MWFRRVFGALALFISLHPALADDPWICLRSPNFELYTTAGEKTGRDALRAFEEIRTAFKDVLGVQLPNDKPVTIVAFRDEKEYAPYQVHVGAGAYYLPLPGRDFIVIQDLLPERYPMILHEYTHVIVNQAGMKLPLWLNEGFAELYATLKPMGREIRVGRIIPARLQVAQGTLLDLHEVLNADAHSMTYNENNHIGIFYAESWALTHMLKFSRAYSSKFERLMDAIGQGVPSEKALEQVYGKPLEAIQTDLQIYVHGHTFREGVIHGKLLHSRIEPVLVPLDPLETAVMLAGIETHGPHRSEAMDALEQLASANPGKPAPLESLARLYLSGSNPQAAEAPFRRALTAGTKDAGLCLSYAIQLRTSIPQMEYVAALRRATEIDPDLSPAQQLLAAYAFDTQDYAEALARLHLVKKLERGQAFAYYRVLSVAAFETGRAEEAKSAAERMQQFASSADEHRLADETVQKVSGASRGPGSQ